MSLSESNDVRTYDGIPPLSAFASKQGTPLIIDKNTQIAYFVDAATDTVKPLAGSGGSGTVTSVALTAPSEFVVAGSPITGAGTLAVTKANQTANTAWAGPTTGAAAQPAFRALVTADLPDTAVTPGTYTNTTLTVDQKGRLTAASNGAVYVAPGTFNARLTLTSGVAVTTADVTFSSTMYLTPYLGSTVALYTSGAWANYTLTEISLDLSASIGGVLYDIFVYDSSGTLTLEQLAWKKLASTSSPTAGSNKTLNLTDTSTLTVGLDVTVKDGSNQEQTRITAVVANTSITVDTLAHSYTTPDVYGYQTRATALVLQNGVNVKTGETNKRYVGTFCAARLVTTGGCIDKLAGRLLFNAYNRVSRPMLKVDSANTWDYSSTTVRQAHGDRENELNVVIGLSEDTITAEAHHICVHGVSNFIYYTGIGINRTTVDDSTIRNGNITYAAAASSLCNFARADYKGYPGIGMYYFAWLEYCNNNTATYSWIGDNGGILLQSGISGTAVM